LGKLVEKIKRFLKGDMNSIPISVSVSPVSAGAFSSAFYDETSEPEEFKDTIFPEGYDLESKTGECYYIPGCTVKVSGINRDTGRKNTRILKLRTVNLHNIHREMFYHQISPPYAIEEIAPSPIVPIPMLVPGEACETGGYAILPMYKIKVSAINPKTDRLNHRTFNASNDEIAFERMRKKGFSEPFTVIEKEPLFVPPRDEVLNYAKSRYISIIPGLSEDDLGNIISRIERADSKPPTERMVQAALKSGRAISRYANHWEYH